MAILVKKYRVRHNGKTFFPGQVITGLSEEEEARLLTNAGESLEKYVPPEKVSVESRTAKSETRDEKVATESENDTPAEITADALIQSSRRKK